MSQISKNLCKMSQNINELCNIICMKMGKKFGQIRQKTVGDVYNSRARLEDFIVTLSFIKIYCFVKEKKTIKSVGHINNFIQMVSYAEKILV